jgi:hypothetical protein
MHANWVGLETVVRHVDGSQCLAWYGNVQVLLSLEPPTFEFMRTIVSELEALEKGTGLGTGTLLVIKSDVAPPSEEARTYIRQGLSKSSMLAAAQVVEGTGFRGAAMRSVLSMIQLAIRPPYAMKIFDNVRSGSMWLATELEKRAGRAPNGLELAQVTLDLQARFLARTLQPTKRLKSMT